jgi:exodeoxyribonuclease VII small subunit
MTSEITQPARSPQIASFEEGLATLGDLVSRLESGALGLSESIAAYERGVGILRQLHEELARADERVSVLVRIDEEGRPILMAHDVDSTGSKATDEAPTRRRPRGKTSRGRSLPGMDDPSEEA